MKTNLLKPHRFKLTLAVAALAMAGAAMTARAADVIKADNANNLNLGSSWVGGVPPTSSDVGVWDNTVTAANLVQLGADTNWAGIRIANAGGAVTLGVNALALTVTAANPTLTYTVAPVNPLVNGDRAFITAGTVPTGFTALTSYYVINATATTFQLSATAGGTAITPTTAGATVVVTGGGTLTLGASGLDTSGAAFPLTVAGPVVASAPQNWNLVSGVTLNGGLAGANASGNDVTLTGSGILTIGGRGMTLSNLVVNTGTTVVPLAGGSGIISLNGGTFFINGNVNEGVQVTATGGRMYNNVSRTWSGNLTGSGPLQVDVRGNFMQWGGNHSGYSGAVTIGIWNGPGGLRLNGPNAVSAAASYTMDAAAQAYVQVNGAGIYNLGSLSGGGMNGADTSGYLGTAAGQNISIGALNTDTTFSGNTRGAGGIIKTGTGRLTLDGVTTVNTHSGFTTISNGVLQIGSGGAAGLLGRGPVTNLANLVFNMSGTQTLSNSIAGTGNLTNIGTGKIILTGTNSYSGPAYITAGQLTIGSASQVTSAMTVGDGATLGARPATAVATVIGGAANFGVGCSYEFDLGTLPNPTSTSVVSNTGNINLAGNVTVNLGGTNTTLTSGTITLLRYASRSGGGSFVLGTLPDGIVAGGAGLVDDTANKEVRLTINVLPPPDLTRVWVGDTLGAWDIGNLANQIWKVSATAQATNYNDGVAVRFDDTATGTTNINLTTALNPSSVTVDITNKTYTFGGAGLLSGSTGLLKRGPGTLITTNANSYAGVTTIEGGTLKVAGQNASLGGGGVANSGSLVLDISESTNALPYTLLFNGQISGTGAVSFVGLDQTNSFVELTIADGSGNPYSGGTALSNVYVRLNGPANDATRSAAKSTGLGSGLISFLGQSTLELEDWGVLNNSGQAGNFAPAIDVPVGHSGTLLTAGRMSSSSVVTGGGTFNLGISSVRDDINCNFSAFTGQVNVFPNGSADFRVGNAAGFPLAKLHVAPNVTMHSILGSGTIIRIGELAMETGSFLGFGNNATWLVGGLNTDATNAASIASGNVSLVKEGTGTWTLSGEPNNYTGTTTVSNGVLALVGYTSISNSSTITLVAPGILDVSGRTDGTLGLGADISTQTLRGNGTIRGSLAVGSLGIIRPGFSIGVLTVTNTVALGGTTVMELDRTAPTNSDRIVSTAFSAGGDLTVTNIGAPLQAGDTFQLFSTNVTGSFAVLNLPTNDPVNFLVYTWINKLAVDGTIVVQSAISTVNQTPTNIVFAVTGGTLDLQWPADHIGWRLETNSVALTVTNAWFTYPGSAATNHVIITIDPALTNVFYRLVFP